MLEIRELHKSYGDLVVLNIDNHIFESGCYWIRGANGTGKSTFFKVLAGIIPFDGSVTCSGLDIKRQPVEYRRKVNYSPSEPIYPDFVTPQDLMLLTAKTKSVDATELKTLLERLGLSKALHQSTGSFSSGMLKKTSLTLALAGNPSWIILDEPFSTLDHESSLELVKIIQEKRSEGASILFSSHIEDDFGIAYDQSFRIESGVLK